MSECPNDSTDEFHDLDEAKWLWMAGVAMSGLITNPNFFSSVFQQYPQSAAEFAAEAADAVFAQLAARQKREG